MRRAADVRGGRRLALPAAAGTLVLAVVALSLAGIVSVTGDELVLEELTFPACGVLYAAVGLVIVRKHPGHRIGWLFLVVGLFLPVGALAEQVSAQVYLEGRTNLPGGFVAAWVSTWYWVVFAYAGFVLVPLLFPNGQPISPRWAAIARAACVAAVVTVLGGMFGRRVPVDGTGGRRLLDNPLGVLPFDNIDSDAIGPVVVLVMLAFMLAGLASVVLRYRRSRQEERQQLKWAVFGFGVFIGYFLLLPLVLGVEAAGNRPAILDIGMQAVIPVTMGVAVLRYRLYEIDRVINRAVVYLAVTGLLALAYVLPVVLAQAVLPGQERPSWVVAGATLGAAALFQPVRRRVQSAVDRRFNRARYDAGRTIDDFRRRLRDQVDIEQLRADLLDAVGRTVEPRAAVVWLRS